MSVDSGNAKRMGISRKRYTDKPVLETCSAIYAEWRVGIIVETRVEREGGVIMEEVDCHKTELEEQN